MHNQIIRGLIFIILVFLVTSDLKEIISTIATSSSISTLLHKQSPGVQSSHRQRSRREVASQNEIADEEEDGDDEGPSSSIKIKFLTRGAEENSDGSTGGNENESLDPVKRLSSRGQSLYAKTKSMKLTDDERKELLAMKTQLTSVMQEWCLPKLVCELHASVQDRGSLTEAEKGLLSLIRETSLGTMGEVVSRYHFAAHMGQLLSGVEGNGCHNFYPNCPLSGTRVLQMMKKVRIR